MSWPKGYGEGSMPSEAPELRTMPFWRDEYPRPDVAPAPLPGTVDVAIVGAGITGLNAARVLADAGASVAVLDSGSVGAGASSLNGGMVNYGLKAATTRVFERFGPELGRELWAAALRSIDLVEQLVAEHEIDCSFVRGGAAELGFTAKDRRNFTEEAEWMERTVDFTTEIIGPDRLTEVIDSPFFHCAMVDKVGAGLHPARYVDGLATAAIDRGASIHERAEVRQVTRHTNGYSLLTSRGKVNAAALILATNGYTTERPVESLRRRVVPVGSYIIVTEPLDRDQAERLIPANRMMWTARRFLNYMRRTPDNRILIGGRNDLSTTLDLHESARILGRRLGEFFPELSGTAPTHSWSGRLGVTFDLLPHIGRIDGMWYALGYGGHGVGIATYVGTELGSLISGRIDRSPFAEIPHPTRPYYRGNPWFLPLAARWYRFLDRVGR